MSKLTSLLKVLVFLVILAAAGKWMLSETNAVQAAPDAEYPDYFAEALKLRQNIVITDTYWGEAIALGAGSVYSEAAGGVFVPVGSRAGLKMDTSVNTRTLAVSVYIITATEPITVWGSWTNGFNPIGSGVINQPIVGWNTVTVTKPAAQSLSYRSMYFTSEAPLVFDGAGIAYEIEDLPRHHLFILDFPERITGATTVDMGDNPPALTDAFRLNLDTQERFPSYWVSLQAKVILTETVPHTLSLSFFTAGGSGISSRNFVFSSTGWLSDTFDVFRYSDGWYTGQIRWNCSGFGCDGIVVSPQARAGTPRILNGLLPSHLLPSATPSPLCTRELDLVSPSLPLGHTNSLKVLPSV